MGFETESFFFARQNAATMTHAGRRAAYRAACAADPGLRARTAAELARHEAETAKAAEARAEALAEASSADPAQVVEAMHAIRARLFDVTVPTGGVGADGYSCWARSATDAEALVERLSAPHRGGRWIVTVFRHGAELAELTRSGSYRPRPLAPRTES
jgi:hypothetical protein